MIRCSPASGLQAAPEPAELGGQLRDRVNWIALTSKAWEIGKLTVVVGFSPPLRAVSMSRLAAALTVGVTPLAGARDPARVSDPSDGTDPGPRAC